MNTFDCIRWWKDPSHFYFMTCTCAISKQTKEGQACLAVMRSNLGDFSHEFQEGYEEQKVASEARVWWPSTSFGRRTWPEAQVEKLVKHEDAQTNSAKCLGDNMAKWKIEKQQQQHDNVTPCVVPRTKYTCVTLSGMGKHVAQRCTSPPGKCRKSLLAFFRITRLATSYVWRVKRKCKNSNLMHTRRYENGVKRLTTCEYVWTQLNIDERIWTHWTASDGINMRKHLQLKANKDPTTFISWIALAVWEQAWTNQRYMFDADHSHSGMLCVFIQPSRSSRTNKKQHLKCSAKLSHQSRSCGDVFTMFSPYFWKQKHTYTQRACFLHGFWPHQTTS